MIIWLVVSTYPSEKWWSSSSSFGMMTFPTEWKVIKFHGSKPPTSHVLFQPHKNAKSLMDLHSHHCPHSTCCAALRLEFEGSRVLSILSLLKIVGMTSGSSIGHGLCMYVCMYLCMYVSMYVSIYVCMYVYYVYTHLGELWVLDVFLQLGQMMLYRLHAVSIVVS